MKHFKIENVTLYTNISIMSSYFFFYSDTILVVVVETVDVVLCVR